MSEKLVNGFIGMFGGLASTILGKNLFGAEGIK